MFFSSTKLFEASKINSVNPDQTAPVGNPDQTAPVGAV